MVRRKLLVIGLDGASWKELNLLIEKGHLPSLKNLLNKGSHAVLLSTTPPVTGPAWSSFATGKNPGKHGVFGFVLPKGSLGNLKPVTSSDIEGGTFYEILEDKGKKCILINMPVTYPPRIKGTVITSLLTMGDDFVFPEILLKKIPEFNNYRIVPNTSLLEKGRIKEYIHDIRVLEKSRFKCAQKLFQKDWDFFFVLISGTDWINHILYDQLIEFKENDEIRETVAFYEDIDGYVKWFLDNSPSKTNILVISDHGFRTCSRTFFVNEWLRRKGYLNVAFKPTKRIHPHKFSRHMEQTRKRPMMLSPLLRFLFLMTKLISLNPIYMIYSRIRQHLPFTPSLQITPDFDETTAYCVSSESRAIYLNVQDRFKGGKIRDSEVYETIWQRIINELKQIKSSKGLPFFEDVLRKEDVFRGPLLKNAPEIIMVPRHCMLASHFAPIISSENHPLNDHDPKGIFIAHGPNIKENTRLKCLSITDIAPTILHMFHVPIPVEMDGRVVVEMFKENRKLARKLVNSGS
jgi:predicted AlkP superfamily phosphohydrolase/phosphomutase